LQTGALEAHWAMLTGRVLSLSEQELMSCEKRDPKHPRLCHDGGWPMQAFDYVKLRGIHNESYYPYMDGVCGGGFL